MAVGGSSFKERAEKTDKAFVYQLNSQAPTLMMAESREIIEIQKGD